MWLPGIFLPRMRKLEGKVWWPGAYSTCQHRGRVLHFSQGERLAVAEAVLGDRVEAEWSSWGSGRG